MPIVIHWYKEGHSALKPLQSSCTETLLAPWTPLRAAASAVQIFAVFFFSNTERAFEIYENLHHSKISRYTYKLLFKSYAMYIGIWIKSWLLNCVVPARRLTCTDIQDDLYENQETSDDEFYM